jgi:CSLREA domain-containing protein
MAAGPPTFTVNSPSDVVDADPGDGKCETAPGNGVCTLRAAIMEANHASGATIYFSLPGVVTYALTIPPGGMGDETTGDLNITNTMTIVGNGAAKTIIDGNGTDRVLQTSQCMNNQYDSQMQKCVVGPAVVTVSGVTIQNGKKDS